LDTKQVRFCGFGGQGIILAGLIFSHAGIADGKWVTSTSTYGAAARGGACRCDVVISDEPIIFPQVIKPDILIPMSQPAYDRYIGDIERGIGIVIYDEGVMPREIGELEQIGIPATRVAIEELGNEIVANMIILGAIIEMTSIVSKEALISATRENVPETFTELNVKALDIGFNLGRKVRL